MNKVTMYQQDNGEWQAVYVNGKIIGQNHSLDLRKVLNEVCQKLGVEFEYKEFGTTDDDEIEGFGAEFPERL